MTAIVRSQPGVTVYVICAKRLLKVFIIPQMRMSQSQPCKYSAIFVAILPKEQCFSVNIIYIHCWGLVTVGMRHLLYHKSIIKATGRTSSVGKAEACWYCANFMHTASNPEFVSLAALAGHCIYRLLRSPCYQYTKWRPLFILSTIHFNADFIFLLIPLRSRWFVYVSFSLWPFSCCFFFLTFGHFHAQSFDVWILFARCPHVALHVPFA